MCWVMPPASPATTSVSRIASSSEVLPWSTWPMIVTTGGRSTRSSSASSKTGSTSTSSAAWTISIFLSNSSASTWIASSESVCVSVAISPSVISFLIISGTGTPRYSATSLTVEPELTRIEVGRLHRGVVDRRDRLVVGAATAPAAARAALRLVGRAALLAAGGLRVDHDAAASARADVARRALAGARVARRAHALGRPGGGCAGAAARARGGCVRGGGAAAEAAAAAGACRGRCGGRFRGGAGGAAAAARRCGCARRGGRRRRAARRAWLRGAAPRRRGRGCFAGAGLRRGACCGGRSPLAPARAAERLQRERLLDRGRGGLGLDAGSLQLLQQLLAGEPVLLGDFVYALLAHRLTDSTSLGSFSASPPGSARRRARAIAPRRIGLLQAALVRARRASPARHR